MTVPVGYAAALIPLRHTLQTRSAAITFGIDVRSTTISDTALCNAVQAAFTSTLGTVLDSNVTVGPTQLSVGQSDGTSIATVGDNSSAGGAAQTSVPPSVAVLIQKLSATGGKRGRGRLYVPWLLATSVVDEGGAIAGATVTNLQTKATAFRTAIIAIAGGSAIVILHQSGSATPAIVTSLRVDPRIATQRRRNDR